MDQREQESIIKVSFSTNGCSEDVIGIFTPPLAPDEQDAIEQEARAVGNETGRLSAVVRILILRADEAGRKLTIEGGAMHHV